ncbi:hypothetical protein BH11PLA2_BH11PLA2_28410 [soil metagenome]
MRRFTFVLTLTFTGTLIAQSPEPRPLPPSITGVPGQPLIPLTPTAGVVPETKLAPISRYQNLAALPPETAQAVLGLRTGSDWLLKRQQANGRFVAGVNLDTKSIIPTGTEFEQSLSTWAVCQAARFMGDEKLNLAGSQAILSLMTLTTDSPDGCKVPVLPWGVNNIPTGFAAVLALAIFELPDADDKTSADAVKLCRFIKKQMQKDGSIAWQTHTKIDVSGENLQPGLALLALATAYRVTGDATFKDSCLSGVTYYRDAFRRQPNAVMAGTLLPAFVECHRLTKSDAARTATFELADWLITQQATATTVKTPAWAGSFVDPDSVSEPNITTAYVLKGLAAACQLARNEADLQRYPRYRAATVEVLKFTGSLQYTAENAVAFEAGIRQQYVLGGVRRTLTGTIVTAENTALVVLGFQRFLESGADSRD